MHLLHARLPRNHTVEPRARISRHNHVRLIRTDLKQAVMEQTLSGLSATDDDHAP
jgi:hypothetical protein